MGKKNKKKNKNKDEKLDPNGETSITPDDTIRNLIVEQSKDFITQLPNDILCRIISLLPFKSAVKTSFLSTRWIDLWKMAIVQHGTIEDAVNAISGFLIDFDELHRPRNQWGIQFNFGKASVLLAAVAPSNKLHLDFSTGKQEFPRLFGWQLDLNQPYITQQPSPSTFFVKTLYLLSVSHATNTAVFSVVSNFPFLESLTIAKCNGLRSLRINARSKLRKLNILDCLHLKSLHVKAVRLQSFCYRGLLPWYSIGHRWHLVDAMLDFRQGPGYKNFKSNDFEPVLLCIENVRSLTLCRWAFEALICPMLISTHRSFHFKKLEELWWIDYSKEGYNSDTLISFLKLCPSLETLSVTIDPSSYKMPSKGVWANEVARNTQLRHLKVVKLEGFTNEEDHILLAERIKEVVTVEPKFIAKSHGHCLRSLVKVPQLEEGAPSYGFVEEVRHINDLCPKHAHMGL